MIVILTLFLLQACGADKVNLRTPAEPDDWGIILEQRDLYMKLTQGVRDSHGFIHGCDSLIFTSLSVASGYPADLTAAEERDPESNEKTGKYYRTPDKDCYVTGRSGSEISRDQLLGLLWGAWYTADKALVARLIRHGKRSNWIIGRGPYSRTFVTPQLRALMAEVLLALGGEDHYVMRLYPQTYSQDIEGYQRHLQFLRGMLFEKATGRVAKVYVTSMCGFAERSPKDGLFRFACDYYQGRDLDESVSRLRDQDLFPREHLPTYETRCAEYIWEKSPGSSGWEGCHAEPPIEERTYSGTDFMFLVKLVEEALGSSR